MMHSGNDPVWRFPKFVTGKIIIVLDKQKDGESVANYRDRVIALFRSRRMSERHDQRIMTRIFLGGLRPKILDILLQTEQLFHFKSVTLHAEVLEMLQVSEEMFIEENATPLVVIGDAASAAPEGQGAVVEGQGGAGADDAGPAEEGARSGGGWSGRGPPTFIQDGELFYGKPNPKIDELFKAKYVLVLYR